MSVVFNSLIDRLKSRKSRRAFVGAYTRKLIAKQIRAMRNKKDYTQKQMEDEFGIAQSWISDLENPNKPGMVNVQTLLKIADAFDVGLLIRFVPFSTFVEYSKKISPNDLAVASYDQEAKLGTTTIPVTRVYASVLALGRDVLTTNDFVEAPPVEESPYEMTWEFSEESPIQIGGEPITTKGSDSTFHIDQGDRPYIQRFQKEGILSGQR